MLDQRPEFADKRWERVFACLEAAPPDGVPGDARRIAGWLTFERDRRTSILGSLGMARDNARQVRRDLSSELWEHINRLYLSVSKSDVDDVWRGEPHAFYRAIQDGAFLVQGTAEATTSRGEAWHFMQLGRNIERAVATAGLIDAHADVLSPQGTVPGVADYLDWIGILKSRTAFEAYCQVYTADIRPDRIAEFLLLNAEFPRSTRFAAGVVQTALHGVGLATGSRNAPAVERAAGRLRAMLDYANLDEVFAGGLRAFTGEIRSLCTGVHRSIHASYFAPPLETALAS
jgi:uncharacterized alpha-E superfamily protein